MTTGRVRLQHCVTCGRWYPMPRVRCPAGADHQLRVEPVAGDGVVYSFTVTHQAMHQSFSDRVPYRTALIELAEGPRILAVVADATAPITIGTSVSVVDAEPGEDETAPSAAVLAVPVEWSAR